MREKTNNDKQFQKGDVVLAIGTVVGTSEYDDDINISFEASEHVSLPYCWIDKRSIINTKRSHLPVEEVLRILDMVFSKGPRID